MLEVDKNKSSSLLESVSLCFASVNCFNLFLSTETLKSQLMLMEVWHVIMHFVELKPVIIYFVELEYEDILNLQSL